MAKEGGMENPRGVNNNWVIRNGWPESESELRAWVQRCKRRVMWPEASLDAPATNCSGRTLLWYACAEDRASYARVLVEEGASVDFGEDGNIPLHVAAERGHAEVVRTLVEVGVDVRKARRDTGETALHRAARNGHVDVVRILVKAGAEVDALRDTGITPLYVAAQEGRNDVVKVLIAAGADQTVAADIASVDGTVPADIALRFNHLDTLSLLQASR